MIVSKLSDLRKRAMFNQDARVAGKGHASMLDGYEIPVHYQQSAIGTQFTGYSTTVTTATVRAINVGTISVSNKGADSLFK